MIDTNLENDTLTNFNVAPCLCLVEVEVWIVGYVGEFVQISSHESHQDLGPNRNLLHFTEKSFLGIGDRCIPPQANALAHAWADAFFRFLPGLAAGKLGNHSTPVVQWRPQKRANTFWIR